MTTLTKEITIRASNVTDLELRVLEETAHEVSDPLRSTLLSMVDMLSDGKDVLVLFHGSK